MPELPEVECVRRSVEPLLLNKRVARVEVRRSDVCECFAGSDEKIKSVKVTPARLLERCDITQLIRHGKQIGILTKQGPALCVHLGMSGQFADAKAIERRAKTDAVQGKHIHVVWRLSDASAVCFRDPRRFGGIWAYESESALREHRFASLGPDGLIVTGAQLQAAASKSHRAIKAVLLDQTVVAGVGNIYADEALFAAKVSPTRACTNITAAEWDTIARAIRHVLNESIATGGSTLRDYVNANGERGKNQETHAVYGRRGKPCVVCGSPLQHETLAQRTTVWCSKCQQ